MWCKTDNRGLSLLLALCLACGVADARAVAPGEPFPSLAGAAFEGDLPKGLEGRILVVDFWASWCAPCKASFPALSAIQKEFAAKGVVVLGISVDEKKAAYDQFLKRAKPAFATVRDGAHVFAGLVKVPTMPTSFVVDRRGVVRFVHSGYHADTEARLRREISLLLEESS